MDPRDFISLSREIVDHIDQILPEYTEAAYRTSIGRVYYGLLHWLQSRLAITVPRSKIKAYHSYVIEQLEKLLDDESLIDFRFIMKARVEAYYYLELIIGSKNFTECLGCSERIMAEIERGSKDLYDVGDELNYFREAQDAKNGSTKRPRRKQK